MLSKDLSFLLVSSELFLLLELLWRGLLQNFSDIELNLKKIVMCPSGNITTPGKKIKKQKFWGFFPSLGT